MTVNTAQKNTNCLDGMACPECGSLGPFSITATCSVVMSDDGAEDATEFEYDDNAICRCGECFYLGTVGAFRTPHPEGDQLINTLKNALENAVQCGMAPVSSASAGGAVAHSEQVRVADEIRAAIASANTYLMKGDRDGD